MKTIEGWWFTTTEKKLANGDNRQIRIGRTHKVKGEIIPCEYGLHLSKQILAALGYAPGPVIYKVRGSGIIIPHGNPIDKYACSNRTYIAGGIDITEILRKFARLCALDVIHLWDAPDVTLEYLKPGNDDIRAAAAWDAAQARAAPGAAAWDAAQAAARAAAWDAPEAAAGAAAWARAAAVRAAPGAAPWDKQNTRLTKMVLRCMPNRKEAT